MGVRRALGGAPYGARATILVRGVPKLGFDAPSVELHMRPGPRSSCRGVPKFGLGAHAGPATGNVGRAPYGARATILVRGVPK